MSVRVGDWVGGCDGERIWVCGCLCVYASVCVYWGGGVAFRPSRAQFAHGAHMHTLERAHSKWRLSVQELNHFVGVYW
jgi:hypothetical protein